MTLQTKAAEDVAKPPKRAERGERSRELILESAILLFAERGFDGVSLDDISARAGAKRPLILYHFKSKDELWRTAAEQVSRAFNAAVDANLADLSGDDRERLRGTVAAWLDAFVEQPEFPKFLVREGGVKGPRLDWLVRHFNYSVVPHGSPEVRRRLSETVARDALMAIFLAMAALGPLMETSLSYVSGKPRSGVHPLTRETRNELIELIMRFIGAVESSTPSAT
jgi:AcrR family transcriptional regulator